MQYGMMLTQHEKQETIHDITWAEGLDLKKQGKGKLNNKGAAMMVCIIIIAILMVFTFSLMLVSYTYYVSQSKNVASKRCSEAASTLSVAFDKEMQDKDVYLHSNLYLFARCNLWQSNWMPDEERVFDVEPSVENAKIEGFPSVIEVKMHWTPSDEFSGSIGTNTDFSTFTKQDKEGTKLYITVYAEAAGQAFAVTSIFELEVYELNINDPALSGTDDGDYIERMRSINDDGVGSTTFNNEGNDVINQASGVCEKWNFKLVEKE